MKLRSALVLLALVAACSGADPIPVDAFGAAYEKAWCERYARCGVVADVATCEAGYVYDNGQLFASVTAGRASYDPSAARACVDAIASGDCTLGGASECEGLSRGMQQVGEACFESYECDDGYCAPPADCTEACCAGTCAAHAAAGSSCGSSAECADGFCGPADGSGAMVCRQRPAAGETCVYQGECATGLFCQQALLPTDGFGPGPCVARAGRGEACDVNFPAYSCRNVDDFCDAESATCVARAAVGEACHDLTTGVAFFGDSCRYDASCVEGTCVAAPTGTGTPCQGDCETGYTCTASGTCAPEAIAPICE